MPLTGAGCPPRTYIQSGVAAEYEEYSAEEGDFFSSGDGRAGIMYTSINLQRKHNLSFSFIPQRKVCTLCPTVKEHAVLGTPRGGNTRSPGKEVFILSDQSYPPLLPSSLDKSCIRIIRLEFGSLHELVTIFLELLEGRSLASGSLVLIFSATHLANVGLAAYIEDLVATKKRILGGLGRDIHFSPAPPMLLYGTGNRDLIWQTGLKAGPLRNSTLRTATGGPWTTSWKTGRVAANHSSQQGSGCTPPWTATTRRYGQSSATGRFPTKWGRSPLSTRAGS